MDTITVMPLKRWRGAVLLILVAALWVPAVLAENPDWPNGPADDPRDEPPDDPDFWMEWAFFSYIPDAAIGTIRPEEIPLGSGIHADAAWQVTTGDPSVVIAQTDTGIVWDNLDLIEKVLPHRGELPLPEGASDYDANGDGRFNIRDYDGDSRVDDANGNGVIDANDLTRIFADGVDNDGNGYIDDIAGWDFLWDDNDPTDDTKARHGVGVGWWAAAQTNNGVGSAGVCPECMLIPLRVGDDFVGYVNHLNEGLMYGLDNGADILFARQFDDQLHVDDAGSHQPRVGAGHPLRHHSRRRGKLPPRLSRGA
ncbi:MAG: S8 family serine peptidase [Deltaproteobacteria bacterium]|nr:S8 family serine peptidase [Deltaproteobacteria bacterium]